MTLGEIKALALRRIDEKRWGREVREQAGSRLDEVLTAYANIGYTTIIRLHIQPEETRLVETDEKGRVKLPKDVLQVESLWLGEPDKKIMYWVDSGSNEICTMLKNAKLGARCRIGFPAMEDDADEPQLVDEAQEALADYIAHMLAEHTKGALLDAMKFLAEFMRKMKKFEKPKEETIVGSIKVAGWPEQAEPREEGGADAQT